MNSKVCFFTCLGDMNFWWRTDEFWGMFFHLFVGYELLMKDRWISRHVFYLFTGYKFPMKDRWISRHVFNLFTGYEFLMKNGWFQGIFFICLWGMNFWQRMDGFQGVFFICLQGMNFWQRTDEIWGMFFYLFTGYEFLTKDGWILRCKWITRVWFSLHYIMKFIQKKDESEDYERALNKCEIQRTGPRT